MVYRSQNEIFAITESVLLKLEEKTDPHALSRVTEIMQEYFIQEPYWICFKAFTKRSLDEFGKFIWRYIIMV